MRLIAESLFSVVLVLLPPILWDAPSVVSSAIALLTRIVLVPMRFIASRAGRAKSLWLIVDGEDVMEIFRKVPGFLLLSSKSKTGRSDLSTVVPVPFDDMVTVSPSSEETMLDSFTSVGDELLLVSATDIEDVEPPLREVVCSPFLE